MRIPSTKHARAEAFHTPGYDNALVGLIAEAAVREPMRNLDSRLTPDHVHLASWPAEDGELSPWMHGLTTTQARRDPRHYRSPGHARQGRDQARRGDEHPLAVLRYNE